MKKLIILLLFIPLVSFGQTQNDLIRIGVKERTAKTIFKKFDGNVAEAINKWADSGNGKLSQEFIDAIDTLGFNKIYLDSKLKLARQQRLKQGILGIVTIATGVALANSGGYSGGGGDYLSNNYASTYYSEDYDYSKKKKRKKYQYDMTTLPELSTENYSSIDTDTYNNYFDTSTLVDVNDSNFSETNYKAKSSEEILAELGVYESTESNPVNAAKELHFTPIVYGSSSNYVDGINQTSSGFDETGLLNIYNSSGNTIGAVRKNTDGYAIYEDGNESSFISNPDNEGVSTIYRGGIPVGAQKTDNDGNITYYEDGNATGYSKKVRNGYENYDSGGIIKSFTATGKK
jgi:hypothetical protein